MRAMGMAPNSVTTSVSPRTQPIGPVTKLMNLSDMKYPASEGGGEYVIPLTSGLLLMV